MTPPPPTINLGAAAPNGIMAGPAVTCITGGIINADVSISPGNTITGFGPCVITGVQHLGDAVALAGQTALTTAYNTLVGLPCPPANAIVADLGGTTKAAGVYCTASGIGVTGTLTLDGGGDPNATFVFQAGTSLITAGNIVLINGAQAKNVYWQVGTLGHARHGVAVAGQHPRPDEHHAGGQRDAARPRPGAERVGHAGHQQRHHPAVTPTSAGAGRPSGPAPLRQRSVDERTPGRHDGTGHAVSRRFTCHSEHSRSAHGAGVAVPAAAQQRGTVEFGAFGSAGVVRQEPDAQPAAFGGGGRVGVFLDPRWALEFEKGEMRATRTLGLKDVNVGILVGAARGDADQERRPVHSCSAPAPVPAPRRTSCTATA